MEAVNEFFQDKINSFIFKRLNKLEHKWAKIIDVKGDYIEK
jgi:hypothetical protein